jgi:hypothetical protein
LGSLSSRFRTVTPWLAIRASSASRSSTAKLIMKSRDDGAIMSVSDGNGLQTTTGG